MTKKHFQKLAYELHLIKPEGDSAARGAWNQCCDAVARACRQSNPAFDSARFLAACNAESYTPAMHGR